MLTGDSEYLQAFTIQNLKKLDWQYTVHKVNAFAYIYNKHLLKATSFINAIRVITEMTVLVCPQNNSKMQMCFPKGQHKKCLMSHQPSKVADTVRNKSKLYSSSLLISDSKKPW